MAVRESWSATLELLRNELRYNFADCVQLKKRKDTDTIYMLNAAYNNEKETENDNSNQANSPKFIVHSKRQSQSS